MAKIKRKKKKPQMSEKEQRKIRIRQIGAIIVAVFIIITMILPMVASSSGF